MEKMEYLVVVETDGDLSSESGHNGQRIHSFRCNRKDTADAAADWLNRVTGTVARVFHDPPPIGQGE